MGDKRYASIWLSVYPRDSPWRCLLSGCPGTDLQPDRFSPGDWECGSQDGENLGLCCVEPQGTVFQQAHSLIHPQALRLLCGPDLHRDLWRVPVCQ